MVGANLMEADLRGADLTHADLDQAEIEGTDLSTAVGLTRPQVDQARVGATTRLPPDLGADGT